MSEELLLQALKTEKGMAAIAEVMLRPIPRNLFVSQQFLDDMNDHERIKKSCQSALDIVNRRLVNEKDMSELDRSACLEVKSKIEVFFARN